MTKGQKAYCDRDHPGSDEEAARWCETHHWVEMPKTPEQIAQEGREALEALRASGMPS
jgi:hypothetical protein